MVSCVSRVVPDAPIRPGPLCQHMHPSSRQNRIEAAKRLQEKLRKLAEEGRATQENQESSPPTCIEDVLRISGYDDDTALTDSPSESSVPAVRFAYASQPSLDHF